MTALVARLSAVVVAVIVALGLVIAPPNTAPEPAALAAASIADIQLQAAASATPQANATTPTINDVVEIAALIAATPLWYAAVPITLPVSLAFGIWFSLALNIIHGSYNINLAESLAYGVATYFAGPLVLISSKLSPFLPSSAAPGTAQTRQTAAGPSLEALIDVVQAVGSAAFWYATLPITLPSVIVGAAWKELYWNLVSGHPQFDIGGAVLRAVITYLTTPLDAIKQSLTNLFQPTTPVAAQAQSRSVAEPTARQSTTPAQRSVASSRRAALAATRAQPAPAADLHVSRPHLHNAASPAHVAQRWPPPAPSPPRQLTSTPPRRHPRTAPQIRRMPTRRTPRPSRPPPEAPAAASRRAKPTRLCQLT
ncbi:hypothetical protein [Mycobacterium sp. M26]|uniref:hypothetical protein n=1 Tax=Mycobacterium sp. M26 TaxID=1762962 RepID=UPI000AAE3164|nr:hypothetical protein [Mycobacterium sp. M26]